MAVRLVSNVAAVGATRIARKPARSATEIQYLEAAAEVARAEPASEATAMPASGRGYKVVGCRLVARYVRCARVRCGIAVAATRQRKADVGAVYVANALPFRSADDREDGE